MARRIAAERQRRIERGQWRSVATRSACLTPRQLASNDYLRLSQHPAVLEGMARAALEWGASATASPLICGFTGIHAELTDMLAEWQGYPHGMLWTTGYAANHAVLGLLPSKGDVVLADRLIHASMIAGILRSGSRLRRYRHLDLDHLDELLRSECRGSGDCFVVTESIFSMDGDVPDLARMAALKAHYGFHWIVDEAHGVGWYGPGNAGCMAAVGLRGVADVFVGTLGKALGAGGAFTLFREAAWRDYLVNVAGEFIYSTYLSPALVGAALAAVKLAMTMEPATAQARSQSQRWREALRKAGLTTLAGNSPVVPVELGDERRALAARDHLASLGWEVAAVRPPTVPAGQARLRLSLHTELTDDLWDEFTGALEDAIKRAPASTSDG